MHGLYQIMPKPVISNLRTLDSYGCSSTAGHISESSWINAAFLHEIHWCETWIGVVNETSRGARFFNATKHDSRRDRTVPAEYFTLHCTIRVIARRCERSTNWNIYNHRNLHCRREM